MRAFAAIVALTVTTIITIGGAWICRGEFGIGPEWVLPILLAFVLPIALALRTSNTRRKMEESGS